MGDLRLIDPEPTIELYKTGFAGLPEPNRKADGRKLSKLVDDIDSPLVIAVDAPWGAGKSVFLQCWVGAHANENSGKARTVYFDAFRHDFLDDPLVGLMGAINERFEGKENPPLKRLKEAAFRLALPALRIGAAVVTAGASEAVEGLAKVALDATGDEVVSAASEFWSREKGKREAMKAFRAALEDLAEKQKLVVVVDELDRCRPDYALGLLEVIKHFFDVPNVHFVLGVNLVELANSVRARYGSEIQAEKYLQKFITVRMPLVMKNPPQRPNQAQVNFFEALGVEHSQETYWRGDWLPTYFSLLNRNVPLNLRDVQKIAIHARLAPTPIQANEAWLHLNAGLLVLQTLSPKTYALFRDGYLDDDAFYSVFNLKEKLSGNESFKTDAYWVWTLLFKGPTSGEVGELSDQLKAYYGDVSPRELCRQVIHDSLEVFKI